MIDSLLIKGIGGVILFGYSLVGKGDQLQSLYDYPKPYQNMVLKIAARRAGARQNAVVQEYRQSQK